MPEVQFPQPLVEPVQQNQENPPPQQAPPLVQDPPAAVQIPPQNPLAPQADDGTRGELEVLTKLIAYVLLVFPYACLPHYMCFISYLLTGRISPVRALCIILSVYVCFRSAGEFPPESKCL